MKLIPYLILFALCICTYDANSQSDSRMDRATFTKVDQMPQYPGCEDIVDPSARYNCSMKAMVEYLSEHIVYPAEAKASKLEGTVIVSFVVTKEGAISKAMVAKGFDEACDAEALRVVNEMPNWVAGEHEGKVVNVQMNLPIRFRL